MTAITLSDLTQSTPEGLGIFDTLMRTNRAHLEKEFQGNRIKGAEYATVYLGSLEAVMRTSMEFLMTNQKVSLEVEILKIEVQKAQATLAQILQQTQNLIAENAHIKAQTALTVQQTVNLVAEALNIPKQGELLDAQVIHMVKQGQLIDSQISMTNQQKINLVDELLTTAATRLKIASDIGVSTQQKLNLIDEIATAEKNRLKIAAEISLLEQKKKTEEAQVTAGAAADDSVLGKQKALYTAQADGFIRDAEQKATGILVDTWKVRKTVDDTEQPNENNKLQNQNIGLAVTALLAGIGVTAVSVPPDPVP